MQRRKRNGIGKGFPRHVGPFDDVRREPMVRYRTHGPEPIAIGTQFGALTVTGFIKDSKCARWLAVATCKCGVNEYVFQPNNLRSGNSTQCFKCTDAAASRRMQKYPIVNRGLAKRITNIISRCTKPSNKSWHNYGGRGITVHPEWLVEDGRKLFFDYLLTLPGHDNPILELDRIKNERGYEPGNLRFCTRSVNAANKRQIRDFETIRAGLRFAGLWPAEPLYDLFVGGALSFST